MKNTIECVYCGNHKRPCNNDEDCQYCEDCEDQALEISNKTEEE